MCVCVLLEMRLRIFLFRQFAKAMDAFAKAMEAGGPKERLETLKATAYLVLDAGGWPSVNIQELALLRSERVMPRSACACSATYWAALARVCK